MCVDGLEKAKGDPNIHGNDVEIPGKEAVEQRAGDRPRPENGDLSRVGVLCSEAKGGRVLVVDLVDVFVEGSVVQRLVRKVVEYVFKNEEEGHLGYHISQRREGHLMRPHSKDLCHGVEQPNL